jgi:hypothetical protein
MTMNKMVEVPKKDANNYSLVLTALGMEEEGDPLAEIESLRKDAERFRWLAPRMLAADFDYGGEGTQALVFEMPTGFSASADCSATIDAAMALGG